MRTPSIVVDEKQYTRKLYLSLLKSQIFNSDKGNVKSSQENCQNGCRSKKKQKHINFLSKTNGDIKFEKFDCMSPICTPSTYSTVNYRPHTIGDISKKLDFSHCTNLSKVHDYDKLSLDKFDFQSSENSKPSFKKLINFDIEENEYAKNFLRQKKIPKSPYKVLDAPNLKDDFYLHLLDWSSTDFLAVGLDKSLFIWEGKSSSVKLLTSLEDEHITSVCWLKNGNSLLVGSNTGKIYLWDVEKKSCVTTYHHHSERVGIISKMNTNENMFSSGSQDRSIFNYDIRVDSSEDPSIKYTGHTQEICGLKWSLDDRKLASGGNDNKLIIWSLNKSQPEKKFSSHTSAVKAIDWSPHKFGTLLTGGGTQDRTLKIWNTNTLKLVESIDTSSQVCNIGFSRNSHEFVTTHGYSDNLILVWDSDKMDVKATLKGHKDRVIYLSIGPDSQKIVTGAGDESIRFWDVFIPTKSNTLCESSQYNINKGNNSSNELNDLRIR
jgi:cell division cycle 20-like protein 1 (cofactor of APC complex)